MHRFLEELALPYAKRWDIQADSGCPQHVWGSDFPLSPTINLPVTATKEQVAKCSEGIC